MVNQLPPIGFGRDDSLYLPASKVGPDGIGVVAFVGQQGLGRAFGQVDQFGVGRAIGSLAIRQMEGNWSSSGIGQTMKMGWLPPSRTAS